MWPCQEKIKYQLWPKDFCFDTFTEDVWMHGISLLHLNLDSRHFGFV